MPNKSIQILHNKLAGNPTSNSALLHSALDFLSSHNIPYSVHTGDFSKLILDASGTTDVCIAGGDGTMHHFLQTVPLTELARVRVCILPAGSSNALFNHIFNSSDDKLASLRAFISDGGELHASQLRRVSFGNGRSSVQAVVTSLMAHANLVKTADSQEFRSKFPSDPESRYNAAFQEQLGRTSAGILNLHGQVQKWDQSSDSWTDTSYSEYREEWQYILQPSCDRLTNNFIIAPHSPSDGWTDFVLVLKGADLGAAMMNAFSGNTRRDDNTIYLRCSGEWSYTPDREGDTWGRTVLCDGNIHILQNNCKVSSKIVGRLRIWK